MSKFGNISIVENFVMNETNTISEQLSSGGSIAQNVDGSVTPVVFSSTIVPVGKIFICSSLIFYMEGLTAFNSNLFGNQTSLVNGWLIRMNGVDTVSAKQNRQLAQFVPNMRGEEVFGKLDKTLIGNFDLINFNRAASGVTIRAGNTIDTVVRDDLTGLTFLEVMVQGVYKEI